MSYKDYIKKKKDYSGVLRDSSEREVKVEQTKQAQANRPIGPRQSVRVPEKTMAQKMLDKTAEFLGRTTGFDKLREKRNQVNNVVKTANDLGVFRKIGDTVQGGFNKAFGNNKTAWGTDAEKRDKSEVIQPSFKYKGNIDLNSLPTVQNKDGSQSTVLSFSIQDERDGKETLIPQVINGKIVSEDEAIKHYYETGKHLGKFDTIKEANKYAEKLHEEEEKRISKTNSKANPLLYKTTQRINEKEQEEKKEKLAQNVEVRLPNGLVQQEQKDTWGQVLEKTVQNIQESNLEDTLNYTPKIGLAVGLGAKQGLEQAGQYYYETMPSHVDQGRWGEGISKMERNREIAKEQLIREKGIGVINTEEYQHAGDSLFQQWSRDDQEKINKIIEEAPNYVSRKLAEQAPSFGNSTLGGAAGIVSPIASIGYFFGSSGQSYYEDALNRGMSDEDAYLYSGIMATWESASDSAITAQNVNFLKSKITGKAINGNAMKLIGNQFVENAVQEAVTEPFQELMVGITGGKEYMQTSDLVPRMLDSGFWGGIQGALSGGLTGITASTFNNAQEATSYLRNKIQQQIEKNGKEKFAQDFIKGAQDTMSKSAKRMAEMSIDGSQLTEKQRTDIMRMINKPSSNLEQIKNAIQITQAWNEAVEGAYKNYRGTISDTSWKANVKNKAKEIERLSQTSNQSQNVSLKNVDENIKNMALGVAEERAKEQLEKNGQFKKRGNLTLGNYTINYTINENGEAKITKVTENVETQEIRPSTMENKALSENNQQTIQEEGKTSENATSQEIGENINNVDINPEIDYNNLSDKEIDNEFRRIQEESRAKSYESVRQQGESTINNEGLRKRLSGIFTRELERRGYNTSSNKSLSLKSDKGTTFDMYEDVDAETFHDIFEVAKKYTANGELVDLHEIKSNPEEGEIGYEDTKNYLSSDGLSGFAITKDGDLISVFNASDKKGFLSSIAETVKKEAKTLDCYASPNQNLQEMYQKKFGFKTAAIMDYSMDYDHDDIAKNHNNPQVAFMVNTDQDVETKTFTNYNEAKKYQESFINNNESTQDEGSFNFEDNKGRKLSKQQELFFKNSTNRTSDGKLKTMYRGSTNSTETDFNKGQKATRYTNFGATYEADIKGFYFTDDIDYAKDFGSVKEYYLNTQKTLELNNNIDELNEIFKPLLDDMLENQDISKTQYDAILENKTTYKRFIDEDGVDFDTIDDETFNKCIDIMKALGYDSIKVNERVEDDDGNYITSLMVLDSNQIKNVDNKNPINDTINNAVDETKIVSENAATNENIEKIEDEDLKEIRENSIGNINEKQRTFLESAKNSPNTSKEMAKTIEKDLIQSEIGRYIEQQNKKTLDKARERIDTFGYDQIMANHVTTFEGDKRLKLDDFADGLLLMQHYNDIGDKENYKRVLKNLSVAATENGQMTQILSLMKKEMPQDVMDVTRKSIEKLSKKLKKNITINEKLVEQYEQETNQDKKDEIMNEILDDAVNQLPLTWGEKIDNWRYLAMLGNPKTWIRNKLGNKLNGIVYSIKNKLKGVMEDAAGLVWKDYQKDTTLKFANKDQRTFAKSEAARLGEHIDDVGHKYSNKSDSELLKYKRKFDSKILNTLSNFVDAKLSKDDTKALMSMYSKSLANYMAANNLSSEDLTELSTDTEKIKNQKRKALARASEYAAQQAKEATFHQANALATWLNNLDNSESHQTAMKIARGAAKALLPYRRTPFNIVSQGFMFSPAGIIKASVGTVSDIATTGRELNQQLKEGKISQEDYNYEVSKMVNNRLDEFSKGITGSVAGIGIGLALASMGLIQAGADDDEDKYEEKLGRQKYSLNIGDYSFTLDWLVPSALPIFFGAELYKELDENKEGSVITKGIMAGKRMGNVALQTTMLSSLNDAIAYSHDSEDFISNLVSSYASQFIPSVATNIANTVDSNVKDLTSTKTDSVEKDIDYFNHRLMNIVRRSKLPNKKEAYGEDVRNGMEELLEDVGAPQNEGTKLLARALQNFVLPTNVKKIKTDATTEELERLNREVDMKEFNPLKTSSNAPDDFTIDKKNYKLDNKELNKAKETYGKTLKENLDALIKSDAYKNIKGDKNETADEKKAKLVKDVIEAARESVKAEYTKKHSLPYSSKNDMYNSLTAIKQAGGKVEDYFKFKAGTNDMKTKAERMTYLNNMSLPEKVKKVIYENDVATYQAVSSGTDEHYNTLKSITGNKVSSDYLDYVEKNSNKYFVGDKDANGKAIKGREKKDKVREFVNNSNMSNIEKYYVYAKEGYAKSLSQKQRSELRAALESNKNYMDEETYNSMIKKLNEAEK